MWVTCCLPVWRWSCPMFRLFRLSLRRHTCIVQPSPWWCWNKYNLCNLCSLAETTGTEGCKTLAQLRRVVGDIRNYKHVAANIWMSPCCLFIDVSIKTEKLATSTVRIIEHYLLPQYVPTICALLQNNNSSKNEKKCFNFVSFMLPSQNTYLV